MKYRVLTSLNFCNDEKILGLYIIWPSVIYFCYKISDKVFCLIIKVGSRVSKLLIVTIRVATLPRNLEIPWIWQFRHKKPGMLNNFYTFSSKISIWHKKLFLDIQFFCYYQNFFVSIFKIALQYIFNVFVLFDTVFKLKLNFKLKIDPKMCIFLNLEKIKKNEWQPCTMPIEHWGV